MDESVQEQLSQPARTMRLSEVIRKGKQLVTEESKADWSLCAIGCAYAGVHGHTIHGHELVMLNMAGQSNVSQAFADSLGFPLHICERVNQLHQMGQPALMIADQLEREGY